MNIATTRLRRLLLATTGALTLLAASPPPASDATDVQAVITKWVADFNKGDMKAFVAACASKAAVVDGFPPYAWPSCGEWISAYEANNKAIGATPGTLTIGKVIYSEIANNTAYYIYPATFKDTQKGKPVTYKGTWTMTLQKTKAGWVFTGSASAWGVNTL
jgi:ketosteroid isomerase-like protein